MMDDERISPEDLPAPSPEGLEPAPPRSLRELIDRVTGRDLPAVVEPGDAGLAEPLPFPFLALVGQTEMKTALLLSLINPAVGGVLLLGPRGTGKTTAVRSLIDLLPEVPRSLCHYGCMPEDVEIDGLDAICPDCARKYAQGDPLARLDRVRLVELPLNSGLADVVGGIDERAALHDRMRLRRGILANADQNVLYIDEVNLLDDAIVDAILDAAAQGTYTVRRGMLSATYRARLVLFGSMNPEEGRLRPQIMDRFGLRVFIRGLNSPEERLEAYHRTIAYRRNPRVLIQQYALETAIAREEIQLAREVLPTVVLPNEVAAIGLEIIRKLGVDSLRAEISLFEAARAYACADGRAEVQPSDLRQVAPLALRLRRSPFMDDFFSEREPEETEISHTIESTFATGRSRPTAQTEPPKE
jgi:magnesium chelatase subunit I